MSCASYVVIYTNASRNFFLGGGGLKPWLRPCTNKWREIDCCLVLPFLFDSLRNVQGFMLVISPLLALMHEESSGDIDVQGHRYVANI